MDKILTDMRVRRQKYLEIMNARIRKDPQNLLNQNKGSLPQIDSILIKFFNFYYDTQKLDCNEYIYILSWF